MVDLMMWLVIAALLLAAALQGIGYYQRAAFVHQMVSDASGAGSVAVGNAATQGGDFSVAAVQAAADSAKWSKNVTHTVESPTNGAKPFIRVSNPSVTSSDVIYMFEPCGALVAGANLVPKGGNTDMSACGIGAPVITVSLTQRISGNVIGLAMSADATKMIASSQGNSAPKVSTNSGVTWSSVTGPAGQWRSFASSSDGSRLLTSIDGGTLYTSSNSGTSWTSVPGPGTGTWYAVASSADGTKLFAGKDGGSIYTSTDSGVSWTAQASAGTGAWRSIAASADGMKLVAVAGGTASQGNVFTSSDGGVTWATLVVPGKSNWVSAASSQDGTKLAVMGNYQYIYTSTDSGATWTAQTKAGNGVWSAIASSADGTKLVAAGSNLKVSTDSGATWTTQSSPGTNSLQVIALSTDGNKILAGTAVAGGGALYTGSY